MQPDVDFLWLNLGSSLRCLHRPLLRELSYRAKVAQWDYQQTLDEPASLEIPLTMLHDSLKGMNHPVHLAGHGLSGVLALLYARRHPDHVKSLTLLSVGPRPAISWQSHYYMNRRLLCCDRTLVLSVMVSRLFGESVRPLARELACRLQADLDTSPSPHSLLWDGDIPPGGSPVPLLVCGSQDDSVIGPDMLTHWQHWMNPYRGDQIWQCPEGRHFFHYFQPKQVSRAILQFWQHSAASAVSSCHCG
ncbi:MAG TPA: alpha/beta hydrolase [Leptolyngbyaceae cyanobacterium]